MDWVVDNYKDWYNRNLAIERLIEEKRQKIIKLNLEIATMTYTLHTLKLIGWKNPE